MHFRGYTTILAIGTTPQALAKNELEQLGQVSKRKEMRYRGHNSPSRWDLFGAALIEMR